MLLLLVCFKVVVRAIVRTAKGLCRMVSTLPLGFVGVIVVVVAVVVVVVAVLYCLFYCCCCCCYCCVIFLSLPLSHS